MKKLLLTLAVLALSLGMGIEARHNDCNSCNTGCKTSCKKECKPCVRTCKPCVKECKAERIACPRPCSYQEEQVLEVVVPCPRYVKVIDYKIDKVKQVRSICPPTEAVVGKWSCCNKSCGRCDACHSAGVEIDPETGIMTNHPLYNEAKQDPDLAKKLEQVDRWNKEHGVVEGEGITESYIDNKTTHELGSDNYNYAQNAANFENGDNYNNNVATKQEKAQTRKEKAKARREARAAKKAAKNNNVEIVDEELEVAAA